MMKKNQSTKKTKQIGFSLIELLVGLIIGLLTTLVIMQVFSAFEGQKRTTSGTTDAQTNGSIGLYSLQRDVQLAGFGLPLFDKDNMPLNCTTTSFYLPANATPVLPALSVNLLPIRIVNGATATASDSITVRYGNSAFAGIPMRVTADGTATNLISLDTNIGCAVSDVALIVEGATCQVARVTDASPTLTSSVKVVPAVDVHVGANSTVSTRVSCVGAWSDVTYAISGTQLAKNGTPVVDGVVNMQAQYGISDSPNHNQIMQWVNATSPWDTPGNTSAVCNASNANINCIKAVRVAIIARNGLLEKTSLPAVSTACSSTTAANPSGVCAWDATSASPTVASPAPTVNLTNTTNWNYYRYKVYESVIPLRNVIWTRERL